MEPYTVKGIIYCIEAERELICCGGALAWMWRVRCEGKQFQFHRFVRFVTLKVCFLSCFHLIPPFFRAALSAKVETHTPPTASHRHACQCMFLGTHTLFFTNQHYWIPATIGTHPPATQAVHTCAHTNQHHQIMSSAFCSSIVFSLPPLISPPHTGQELVQQDHVIRTISSYLGPHTALTHREEGRGSFNLPHIHWPCIAEVLRSAII